MADRLVVARLTGSDMTEGRWITLTTDPPGTVHCYSEDDTRWVTMIATGNVEWRDDGACAEVYVPENRLALWRAEHDVEDGPR